MSSEGGGAVTIHLPHASKAIELTEEKEKLVQDSRPREPDQPQQTQQLIAHHDAHGDGKDQIQFFTLDELNAKLKTNINGEDPRNSKGLTKEEWQQKTLEFGKNVLSPPPETPLFVKYLRDHLGHPLMLLLLIASILAFIAYGVDTSNTLNLTTAVVLFCVVIGSSLFSFIQEGKASNAMKAFKNMLPREATAIRDGKLSRFPAADLVPGDICRVCTGDQVPADMRVIWTSECRAETSAITGESAPITLTLVSDAHTKEEARNLMFNTSKIVEGEAYGVVYAIGNHTLIGDIAKMASSTTNVLTPIQKEVQIFVRRLSIFAFCLAVTFFIIGAARGLDLLDTFINAFITVLIACVPEGLPMTVVSCLALAARQLAERKIFVKELRSVETLGSTTVLASDKTGTLTMNKMTVSRIWVNCMALTEASLRDIPRQQSSILHRTTSLSLKRQLSGFGFGTGTPFATTTTIAKPTSSVPTMDRRPSIERQPSYTTSSSGSSTSGSSSSSVEQTPKSPQKGAIKPGSVAVLELIAGVCNRARFEDERILTQTEAAQLEMKEALSNIDLGSTIGAARRAHPLYLGANMEINDSMRQLSLASVFRKVMTEKTDIKDDTLRIVIGEGSDAALFNFIRKRTNVELLRYHWRIVFEQVFNSRNKYALCIVKPNHVEFADSEKRKVLIKGAPEIILKRCSHWLRGTEIVPITDDFVESYTQAYDAFGSAGERVLGFAYLDLDEKEFGPEFDGKYSADPTPNFPQEGYIFVGMVSLVDPPKPTVPEAIRICKLAGVRVIMVTGDHPVTAAAIAKQVGIITKPTREEIAAVQEIDVESVPWESVDAVVVRGDQMKNWTQVDWDLMLSKSEVVFARTTPAQKLKIVENLQRLKEIVAVTGDGVNDAPALKKADIGLAMGISGSDASRDAADVIIMDDDVSALVDGIRLGRTIFDNLKKTTAYTLTHMIPEVMPLLLNLAVSYPLALSPLMILVIDLGTELAPAVSLAYEPSEANVMILPPRNAHTDRLVDGRMVAYCFIEGGLIEMATSFFAFDLVLQYYGFPANVFFTQDYWQDGAPNYHGYNASQQQEILREAQTAYWAMLTGAQVFHIFMIKTRNVSIFQHGLFNNIFLLYGVAIEICLIALIIFVPSSHTILYTADFPGKVWALLAMSWGLFFLFHEICKNGRNRWPKSFFRYLLY